MTLSISELRSLTPESIWLEITPELRERVEREIERTPQSNQIAKYHARLNRFSLYAFQSWLESQADEFELPVELFPSIKGLPWIWEIVNGTALNIGDTRLVIIPSDFTDTEELIVPQEWLDVPNFAGNYYLAVQVDEQKGQICVWGYISYAEVKRLGKYDDTYRNYHLEREDIHDDFEVLWMDCQINQAVGAKPLSLPVVGAETMKRLIGKIAIPKIFSPRLDLKFTDLAAILNSVKDLEKLYSKRNQIISLGEWFEGIFDRVWQPSELVFSFKPVVAAKGIVPSALQSKAECVGSKIIDLKPDNQHIALIVHQQKLNEDKTEILVRICPANESIYLPDELTLNILNEEGEIIPKLSKKSKANNWLQLKFTGTTGDRFSTSVEFGVNRSLDQFLLN